MASGSTQRNGMAATFWERWFVTASRSVDPHAANDQAFDTLANEIPTMNIPRGELTLVDAVVRSGLAKSKSEARRAVEQGGIYLNQQRAPGVEHAIRDGDWIAGRNLLIRKGKKDYALLRREG